MKKFMFCFLIFVHANISPIYANTISMDFLNEDGSVYDTTTCNIGGDIELPTPPTKRGYTFQGWQTITQIEYLESTGSQYIDTGFIPNQNSGMDIDFYAVRSTRSSIAMIGDADSGFGFGISEDSSQSTTKMFIKSGGYATNDTWVIQSIYGGGTGRYYVRINKRSASVLASDASVITYTFPTFQSTNNLSLWLFAVNQQTHSYSTSLKIYSCKLYDNEILVRDFIPVLDTNGTPCMYDKVNNRFYYNAGTGNFIAGPVITE